MRTFTEAEQIPLKEYLASIIGNPTPFHKQQTIYGDKQNCLWCEEWEMIEMLKFLIYGREYYYNDPPPNRLKKSDKWSKEQVEQKIMNEIGDKTREEIIEYFKHWRQRLNES